MSDKKQNSINYLLEAFEKTIGESIIRVMEEEIATAKIMHKEEIEAAHIDGTKQYQEPEQYYNGVFTDMNEVTRYSREPFEGYTHSFVQYSFKLLRTLKVFLLYALLYIFTLTVII